MKPEATHIVRANAHATAAAVAGWCLSGFLAEFGYVQGEALTLSGRGTGGAVGKCIGMAESDRNPMDGVSQGSDQEFVM